MMPDQPIVFEPNLRKELGGMFLLIGALLALLGIAAIIFSYVAGAAAVMLWGALLLISGLVHGLAVFQARNWNGVFVHLLLAVLDVAVGIFCLARTTEALEAVTLVIGVFLVVGGMFRVFGALLAHRRGWGLSVFTGIVGVLLGLLVWKHWPDSSEWVVGTFIGVDLLFQGITALTLGLNLKLRKPEAAPPATV